MVLVSIVNLYFIIPTLILAVILYGFRHIYISASRNIKRVESILRSPIFAHTNATLQGLSTIRALNAEESVKRNFDNYLDVNTSVSMQTTSLKACVTYKKSFAGVLHVYVNHQKLCVLVGLSLCHLHCNHHLCFCSDGRDADSWWKCRLGDNTDHRPCRHDSMGHQTNQRIGEPNGFG